jgi:hypothetical protein
MSCRNSQGCGRSRTKPLSSGNVSHEHKQGVINYYVKMDQNDLSISSGRDRISHDNWCKKYGTIAARTADVSHGLRVNDWTIERYLECPHNYSRLLTLASDINFWLTYAWSYSLCLKRLTVWSLLPHSWSRYEAVVFIILRSFFRCYYRSEFLLSPPRAFIMY